MRNRFADWLAGKIRYWHGKYPSLRPVIEAFASFCDFVWERI
jgi:hypothetical protein